MHLISEQVIYLDFSFCFVEWDFIDITLPFIPRIGETIDVSEFLEEYQKDEFAKIRKQNKNLSDYFIIKSINHFFHQNVMHTNIFLDFHIEQKQKSVLLNYQ